MRKISGLILLVGLFGCGSVGVREAHGENQTIDSTYISNSLDSIYLPYKKVMNQEMDVTLGRADTSFVKYAPESPLGNLIADIVYEAGIEYMSKTKALGPDLSPVISLINFGGLRAPINKGDITKGDIFSLMPFDNTITIVELPRDKVKEMLQYIFDSGGQPVGNCRLQLSKNVQRLYVDEVEYDYANPLYVITSDYLAGGGDKMTFFENNPKNYNSGILIRDAIMDYVWMKKEITLTGELNRLHFIR